MEPDASIQTPDVGSGVVTFGRSYNTNTLRIIGPAGSFKTSATLIAWSAEFTEPIRATTVTIIIATHSSTGVETVVTKQNADVSLPDGDIMANKTDLAGLVDRKVGTYAMRFLRGGTVLAEGTFRLVK